MCFVAESQSVAIERSLQPRRSVDEKERVLDIVFLAQLMKKNLRHSNPPAWKQPNMKDMIRRWTDGGIQPERLVVDHCLIQRDLIRCLPAGGL